MLNRTCLEQKSMSERHREEMRNIYTQENVYDETHPNALSNGDRKGKGTGTTPNGYNLPYFTPGMTHIFDYSRFDTDPSSNAGNGGLPDDVYNDNAQRRLQTSKKIYTYNEQYCPDGVLVDSGFDISSIPWKYANVNYETEKASASIQ